MKKPNKILEAARRAAEGCDHAGLEPTPLGDASGFYRFRCPKCEVVIDVPAVIPADPGLHYWLGCTTDLEWMRKFRESVRKYFEERAIEEVVASEREERRRVFGPFPWEGDS